MLLSTSNDNAKKELILMKIKQSKEIGFTVMHFSYVFIDLWNEE